MLRAFLALILTLSLTSASMAQQTAQDDDRAVSNGAPTLEDILARQRGGWTPPKLPLIGPGADAPAAQSQDQLGVRGAISDSEIWRRLKGGARALPSSSTATGQLVQVLGENWRLFRRDFILKYSHLVLGGVIALLILFYLLRGRIKIAAGRSGKMIPRFSMSHRIAHWFLACTFILMAISGLIILLGRPLLVPLIGKKANAILSSAALQGHNLFGLVFILALLIMIVRFMRGNFFQWADFKWIAKGGGLLGGHASSNHYNFGEKSWYWMVVIVGLLMSATGLLLEFPMLTDVLAWHQASTILHALGAILLIAVAMGHAYIGSVGMEGSLDSMLRGEVDENWAKEHHDLWYEEVTGNKAVPDEEPAAQPEAAS